MKRIANILISLIALTVVCVLVVGTGVFFKRILAADATLSPVAAVPVVIPVSNIDGLSGQPVHITIPSVGISNNLEEGIYNPNNHTWNLSFVNAQYARMSAPANVRGGNTFIYGHNTVPIFKNLPHVTTGDQAIVTTNNGSKFYYQFDVVSEIQPDDVDALSYKGPPILTLQTCSGNWDEKRQVFRFRFLHVETPNSSR